jgi:hypothetical protein
MAPSIQHLPGAMSVVNMHIIIIALKCTLHVVLLIRFFANEAYAVVQGFARICASLNCCATTCIE